MPVDEAIPVLRVTDVAQSVEWYGRLGYVQEWLHRFGRSFPAFASIARDGHARLFLSEHEGDANDKTLVYIRVPDVEAVAKSFAAELVDQPWAQEAHLTDPDGNRLRVGTPRS